MAEDDTTSDGFQAEEMLPELPPVINATKITTTLLPPNTTTPIISAAIRSCKTIIIILVVVIVFLLLLLVVGSAMSIVCILRLTKSLRKKRSTVEDKENEMREEIETSKNEAYGHRGLLVRSDTHHLTERPAEYEEVI